MTAVSFSTITQPNPRALVLIEIPKRVVKKLGAGKRVPVRVNLNGVAYRSTIAVYGGRYYLPARKEICEAARLSPAAAPGSRSKWTPLRGRWRFHPTSPARFVPRRCERGSTPFPSHTAKSSPTG